MSTNRETLITAYILQLDLGGFKGLPLQMENKMGGRVLHNNLQKVPQIQYLPTKPPIILLMIIWP